MNVLLCIIRLCYLLFNIFFSELKFFFSILKNDLDYYYLDLD